MYEDVSQVRRKGREGVLLGPQQGFIPPILNRTFKILATFVSDMAGAWFVHP